MRVILVGFKGSGKTTVGRALADRLGLSFIDTDVRIEQLHAARTGEKLSFREIFRRVGPAQFRELELQAVRELAAGGSGVISLGGGTLATLTTHGDPVPEGIVVQITVERDALFDRVMRGGLPAFLDPADPKGSFARYYEDRMPLFAAHAQFGVDNTTHSAEETAAEIARRLHGETEG